MLAAVMPSGAVGSVCLLNILIAACGYPPLDRAGDDAAAGGGDDGDRCVSFATKVDTCQLTFG
jgi:hypothetical protein